MTAANVPPGVNNRIVTRMTYMSASTVSTRFVCLRPVKKYLFCPLPVEPRTAGER